MQIITDHKWKNLRYENEVPKRVRQDDYDHLGDEDVADGWILYRCRWYHTSDFMRVDGYGPDALKPWQGYLSDTFFSGVVIRISDDGEQYQIGTYFNN